MPGSEEAFGEGHPATFGEAPQATTRQFELSGEGDEADKGSELVAIEQPEHHASGEMYPNGEAPQAEELGSAALESTVDKVEADDSESVA